MKILNSVTIKNLKRNKKRTFVTILGIALSVALICAITTFIASFQKAMIKRSEINSGSYHIMFSNVTEEQSSYIEKNVDKYSKAKSQTIGYAKLEEGENEYKPYVYIQAFDENALKTRGIKLLKGRFPENEKEILIPEHLILNGKVDLNIGDIIKFKVGKRVLDGEVLNQYNPYYTKEDLEEAGLDNPETIEVEQEKEYIIVGTIQRPSFEEYSAPGYTIITKLDKELKNRETQISLILNNPKEAYELYDSLTQKIGIDKSDIKTNDELLQMLGVFKSDRTTQTFTLLATIVIGIILFTSIFVIRNSFNISLTEKTKELGMLASIGATSKQIKNSIFFEGCILGIIAIPFGIIIGIIAIGIVLAIVNSIMMSGDRPLIDNFNLQLQISWIAIIITSILSILMILISAIKPALRASKISPIDAMRESNDIKITNKKLKISSFTKKIFGIEGEIASKNFKRSKKRYRTTIFSIILSIVLFISMNAFIESAFSVTNYTYERSEDNISVSYEDHTQEETEGYFNKISNLDNIEKYAIIKSASILVDTEQYASDMQKEIFKMNNETSDTDQKMHISVYSVGDEIYRKYIQGLGLKYEEVKDKGILYDKAVTMQSEEGKDGVKRIEYNMLKTQTGDTISYKLPKEEDLNKFETIQVVLKTDKTPMSLFKSNGNPALIVSEEKIKDFVTEDSNRMRMAIKSNNPDKLAEDILKLDENNKKNIYNQNDSDRADKSMILIVSIFLYGFIAVISVIGITNVFNTITTNMALRHKEFAVLKSIGMTEKEFKKMINYESLLYGVKSLIIGIPIGLVLSYLIHQVMSDIYSSAYQFPFIPVIISIIFVFAIIFITMRYSVKKSEKLNIIETIRKENI